MNIYAIIAYTVVFLFILVNNPALAIFIGTIVAGCRLQDKYAT